MNLKLMFHRLLWGHAKLRDYELTCLDILRENLPAEASIILDEQLRKVGLIQRWTDRMLVFNFDRCPQPATRFANRKEKDVLARVLFSNSEKVTLQCDFGIYDGRIFSLAFDKEPRPFFKSKSTIKSFKVFENVMTFDKPDFISEGAFSGPTIAELQMLFKIEKVTSPASAKDIEKFRAIHGSTIPEDFIHLVEETNGFHIGEWVFNGLNARHIMAPEGIYISLMENETMALCVIDGAEKPLILLRDQIDEEDKAIGDSFIEALKVVVLAAPNSLFE